MSAEPELDAQIAELLRRGLPVPEHREGYREQMAAALTAEAVRRAGRRRWRPELAWREPKSVKEPATMKKVAPRRARPLRRALLATAAVVLFAAVTIAGVEAARYLGEPTMVLRITDDTVVDPSDPAAEPHTTIVATTLVSLDETKRLIEDLVKAINTGDTEAVRTFYLTNGWLDNDADKTNLQGSVGIANYWRAARDELGLSIEVEGDPIPYDRYIAQRVKYSLPGDGESRTGVHVFQIGTNGQITHQWITGWIDG